MTDTDVIRLLDALLGVLYDASEKAREDVRAWPDGGFHLGVVSGLETAERLIEAWREEIEPPAPRPSPEDEPWPGVWADDGPPFT